jgi:hypothetical protein
VQKDTHVKKIPKTLVRIPDWERGISWKTAGREQLYQQVFQDLGRIRSCGRGLSGKTVLLAYS